MILLVWFHNLIFSSLLKNLNLSWFMFIKSLYLKTVVSFELMNVKFSLKQSPTNKIMNRYFFIPYKVIFPVIIPIKNANRNNNCKSKKWLNSIKTPKAMTKTMDILIVQNFIKYLMKLNNRFILKSTYNYCTTCERL